MRDPRNDPPMNEYEVGLFNVVMVLTLTILEMGADANMLTSKLREQQKIAFDLDKPQAGAVAGIIANMIDKARGISI
jgi:hypothetical protein